MRRETGAVLELSTAEAVALAQDIGRMIETARQRLAHTANAALTMLHWKIGVRIRQDILQERRAEYGAAIVSALGRKLEARLDAASRRRTCAA